MKMAMLGQVFKNWGNLGKMTGLALSGMLALSGAAFAQTLSVVVNAPETYAAETPVQVTITIDRTDAGAEPDSDVTALGAEITLPNNWKAQRAVDSNCAVAVSDNQVVGVNSKVQVKGSNVTYIDPPNNTTCSPIPATGNVLEIFWIPESGGSGDPLPVNFPVVVTATLVPTTTCATNQAINGVVKYRVRDGQEQTANGGDTTSCEAVVGCSEPGDADGNGSVTPGDATAIFNFFLTGEEPANADCADVCGDGNVTPGDATQAFTIFLTGENPC